MKKLRSSLFLGMLAVGLYLPARSHAQDREDAVQPAVFVMSNDADRNEVLSYQRAPNGQLLEGPVSQREEEAVAAASTRWDLKDRCF